MFRWLRNRRIAHASLEEVLRGVEAREFDPSESAVNARIRADPQGTVRFVERRLSQISESGGAAPLLNILSSVACLDASPDEHLLRLSAPYLEVSQREEDRDAAIGLCCWVRSAAVVPYLLRIFGTESSQWQTIALQISLGRLRVKEALPRLAKNARIQKDTMIRRTAVDALGSIGGREAIAHLRDIFEHDGAEEIRVGAAIALAKNGYSDAESYLERVFKEGDARYAVDVAVYWLGNGDRSRLGEVLSRMELEKRPDLVWVPALSRLFPQAVGERKLLKWMMSMPPSPRLRKRVVRWIRRNQNRLQWNEKERAYLVPGVPVPG